MWQSNALHSKVITLLSLIHFFCKKNVSSKVMTLLCKALLCNVCKASGIFW